MSLNLPARQARRVKLLGSLLAGGALCASAPAAGQSRDDEPIVITAERIRPLGLPERIIEADDVSAYGLGTIGELLGEIAAESGAGEISILVDGRLVRGFGSIEDFPVEAVDRIEVLPRGSAALVGGPLTARAYNVVLRPKTRVVAAEVSHRFATDGSWSATAGEASFTAIDKPRRINLTLGGLGELALLESDRDIIQPAGSMPGLGRARTLRPSLGRVDAGLSASDQIAPWLRASLTAKLNESEGIARLGLSDAGQILKLRTRGQSRSADARLEGDWGAWLVSLDGGYREQRRRTLTDLADGDRQRIRTVIRSRSIELSGNGPLFRLPAGQLRLAAAIGWTRDTLDSTIDGMSSGFGQTMRNARAAIDVPIASRSAGFLAPLGELALGGELRRSRVSGQGTLSSDTLTARWQPIEKLSLFGSLSRGRSPPSVSLLAEPLAETPGVRYFDPLLEETVDVTTISGGNPDLRSFTTTERRLSVQFKPLDDLDLSLSADYTDTRNRNLPATLPVASALIIAAFPDRFIRDSGGTLVRVDLRPVSFARQDEKQLRYGFNLTVPLAKLGWEAADESRRGRIQLTASHTILLESDLLIRPGIARVDLLSRSAAGLGGASRPRHQFDVTLGYAERGLGIRLNAERRTASFLDLGGAESADLLRFAPLTTVGVRVFAEGSRIAPDLAWLKGSRLSLGIVNLTNARERVRDDNGLTPLSYQRAYRDPLGRTVEVEFRKTF